MNNEIEIFVPGMIELYEALINEAKFTEEEALYIINQIRNNENENQSD